MKALILEFFYEKKAILTSIILALFIYILYIPIFSNSEAIVSMLASFLFASLYGGLVCKRKNTNFEIFLSTTPLGRKTIINAGYLISLIFSIAVTIIFFILYFIRKSFIHIEALNALSLNHMLIFASFGFGLIANAILFPSYVLPDKENTVLIIIARFLTLLICTGALFIIFKLEFLNFNIRILIYLISSFIIYIISYLLTINIYLKKSL